MSIYTVKMEGVYINIISFAGFQAFISCHTLWVEL